MASPLEIVAISIDATDVVSLEVAAEVGRTYSLQSSTDLRHWQSIANGTARPDGRLVLRDPEPASHAMRYYRISLP